VHVTNGPAEPRVPTRSARYHWPPGDRGGSPALRRPTTTGRRGRDRLGGLCGHRLHLTLGGRCPGSPCSAAWSRRCARPMPTDAHLLAAAPMRGPDAGELPATRVPDGARFSEMTYRREPRDQICSAASETPTGHAASLNLSTTGAGAGADADSPTLRHAKRHPFDESSRELSSSGSAPSARIWPMAITAVTT
jgi:hypothetical protein